MAKYQRGVAGIWEDDVQILQAARKMRQAGYTQFDAITPFPIHGMEEAIGIKRSMIPWVTFFAGLLGCAVGMGFQYWASVVSWPINVGGKPLFSLPAFVPITFELTILLAALSSVGALLYLCGLPKIDPPIIDPDITSHKFALWVPDTEINYNGEQIENFFKELGAIEVKHLGEY